MNSKRLALISILVNFILSLAKFLVGFLIASVALIADGIHSIMDVFSSAIAYLGISQAEKEESDKYPYGRYRFESIAAFIIVIFLVVSALWILWEAYQAYLKPSLIEFSAIGIGVMIISIVSNEIMARFKFKIGGESSSLALVADAEHDRADVISSVGVLIGLFIMPYFALADSIIAGLVGLYIIYESIHLAREAIDSLVDVADKELEEKIENIAREDKIELEEIKSRKIGGFSFAEIEIKLPANISLDKASAISEKLENRLLDNIKNLKQVVVSARSHDISRSTINQRFGFGRYRTQGFGQGRIKKQQKIDLPEKRKGIKRVVTSVNKQGQVGKFGSKKYLVEDFDRDGKKIFTKEISNPFWSKEANRGGRFAKSAGADKIITKEIGPAAKENLKGGGIEIEIEN